MSTITIRVNGREYELGVNPYTGSVYLDREAAAPLVFSSVEEACEYFKEIENED